MLELDIALTDFLLSAQCLYFSVRLWRRASPHGVAEIEFAAAFASLGLAALLGGVWHGFLSLGASAAGTALWTAALLAMGVTAVALWCVAAALAPSRPWARALRIVAAIQFLAFVGLLFRTDAFALGSLNLMAPVGATTVLYLRRYLETRRRLLVVGIAGFALIVLAGGVLVGDLALPPLGPIAVFHLAQMIALWLVFVSIRGLAPHPA